MRALDRYRKTDTEVLPEPAPTVSEVHQRVVNFLDELISTMLSQNTAFSPVVKMLHRMKPAVLKDLSQIPEDQLQAFMVDLGQRMIDAGTPQPTKLIEIESPDGLIQNIA